MMKIAVTLLSSYLYCPRKLFLEKVLMLEEPPKESLVMGSIRHETYDFINKKEEEIAVSITKGMSFQDIKELYKNKCLGMLRKVILDNKKRLREVDIEMFDAYEKSAKFIAEEADSRADNIFSFIQSNKVYGDELWQKLNPKIISELRIESDELMLKGIIDQIHVYEDSYVPFELKTGRTPQDGVWPSHRIQIAAYSLLMQEHFSKQIKEGFVFYLDSKQKRHIAINPYMRDEVKQLVSDVISLIEGKELPSFCDNKNKCTKCGLKDTCYDEKEVENLLKVKIR